MNSERFNSSQTVLMTIKVTIKRAITESLVMNELVLGDFFFLDTITSFYIRRECVE